VLGCTVKAPSTLGTFLRSFRWGHARQLDRVSRELLARAWAAGAGPGEEPFTIDLDSTLCETYGLAKEGTRHHGYSGQRGYHPLLAVAAGTGDVLMAVAPSARGGEQAPPAEAARPSDEPVVSPPPRDSMVAVSAGSVYTCGLRESGSIDCWGLNVAGVGEQRTRARSWSPGH